jgi:hypothetical protein
VLGSVMNNRAEVLALKEFYGVQRVSHGSPDPNEVRPAILSVAPTL